MVAPSSRSQYYAKYSEPFDVRTESSPFNLWQQRQQQRAQERDHRAQSVPKRPPASPQNEAIQHEHRDRSMSVGKVRQEPFVVATPNQEERDQSAQRERVSSSVRGRQEHQERQERAHSALRERHERAQSARRERQDLARLVTDERQERPQSAPKDRNSERQPASQVEKRT
jgi:hypothetical protein